MKISTHATLAMLATLAEPMDPTRRLAAEEFSPSGTAFASVQSDLTTYGPALKTIYSEEGMTEMIQDVTPFWSMVEKDTNFTGASFTQPISYAGTSAVSPILANLLTSVNGGTAAQGAPPYPYTMSQQKAFVVTRARTFALARLDRETVLASEDKKGAFEELIEHEVDRAMNAVIVRTAGHLYGTGFGSLGTISAGSTVGSATISLADPTMAQNWNVGDVVVASATDGSALRSGTSLGYVAITGIDYVTGALTAAVNWNNNTGSQQGINGLAAGDFLYHADEAANGATNLFLNTQGGWSIVAGLQAWLPTTAPGSTDSFAGVNRSVSSRLSGIRIVGTGAPLDEVLQRAAAAIYANGGKPTHVFLNPANWAVLMNLLQSKVTYFRPAAKQDGEADIGFEMVKVYSPGGTLITIVADPFCPSARGFVLQLNTWTFRSARAFPHIQCIGPEQDGDELIRINNFDQYELRISGYGNLVCKAPGWNAVLTIDAVTAY